jgi:hypothetical protein
MLLVNGPVAMPPLELHTTSSIARFLVPYARRSTYRHSFFLDSIRIYNSIPQPLLDNTSLDTLKQELLDEYLEKQNASTLDEK